VKASILFISAAVISITIQPAYTQQATAPSVSAATAPTNAAAATAAAAAVPGAATASPSAAAAAAVPAGATTATAGEVQQLQQLQQRFPQPPSQAQGAPLFLQQFETDPDDEGEIASFQPKGQTYTPSSPFFQNLGTNGRTCFTCHQPQNAWGLSKDSATARFAANPNEPLFRLIDGATCPSDDVSTPAGARQAYSLLTNKGLIRISLPMQASMQFQIRRVVQDAFGNCNTNPTTGLTGAQSGFLSFYRRPLPSANLGYLSNIMWDTREPTLGHQPWMPPSAMPKALNRQAAYS
jgi:hypothetical protein